ncbi:hypothetical protein DFH07DRAFT_937812 [Mycena maculata]|uniref:Uncharacterized protein n=1 Tax=Mycena maculata TaxID=230809 RepID=A0AAD7JTA4_9AGAR|nr:hypothetical protein DFH07DRAFT_937812 [Mycena maculata]
MIVSEQTQVTGIAGRKRTGGGTSREYAPSSWMYPEGGSGKIRTDKDKDERDELIREFEGDMITTMIAQEASDLSRSDTDLFDGVPKSGHPFHREVTEVFGLAWSRGPEARPQMFVSEATANQSVGITGDRKSGYYADADEWWGGHLRTGLAVGTPPLASLAPSSSVSGSEAGASSALGSGASSAGLVGTRGIGKTRRQFVGQRALFRAQVDGRSEGLEGRAWQVSWPRDTDAGAAALWVIWLFEDGAISTPSRIRSFPHPSVLSFARPRHPSVHPSSPHIHLRPTAQYDMTIPRSLPPVNQCAAQRDRTLRLATFFISGHLVVRDTFEGTWQMAAQEVFTPSWGGSVCFARGEDPAGIHEPTPTPARSTLPKSHSALNGIERSMPGWFWLASSAQFRIPQPLPIHVDASQCGGRKNIYIGQKIPKIQGTKDVLQYSSGEKWRDEFAVQREPEADAMNQLPISQRACDATSSGAIVEYRVEFMEGKREYLTTTGQRTRIIIRSISVLNLQPHIIGLGVNSLDRLDLRTMESPIEMTVSHSESITFGADIGWTRQTFDARDAVLWKEFSLLRSLFDTGF